ncbi:hypothetical protein niasHT_030652 [Heterodera trifolii]|uniref:CCAAT-binding factor domain-containing protein n=1 Tax=Heterodera trifolii TaxID=157864 RepID=A0ABD2HPY3_9BILA
MTKKNETSAESAKDWQLLSADVTAILSELKSVALLNEADSVAFVKGFIEAFLNALLNDEPFEKVKIVKLAKRVFRFADLNLLLLQHFAAKMRSMSVVEPNAKPKLAHFFAEFPISAESRDSLLTDSQLKFGKISLDWARHCVYMQKAWLELLQIEFNPKLCRLLFPRFIELVMDHLPNSELFADVLYRTFQIGGFMSVISLGGIFKLIVKRNLDHPNFYAEVYKIMHTNICYSNYAQKFFDLVDLIMSSSHIPTYVVCPFTKKLCRLLLFAPAHCQLPLIQLIKNLFCRHPTVHSVLIDRPQPTTFENDPYDEQELDLQKSRATDSSLWELKAIQWHWHDKVSAKANFVNSNVQDEETSLGWLTADEMFEAILERANTVLATSNGRKGAKFDEEETPMEEEEEGEEAENGDYYPDAIGNCVMENGTGSRRKRKKQRTEWEKGGKRRAESLFSSDQNAF